MLLEDCDVVNELADGEARVRADFLRQVFYPAAKQILHWHEVGTLNGIGVGLTEPLPGYLVGALGLVNLTPPAFSEAVENGEDVAISVLDETMTLYTDHDAEALIYNEQTTGATTEQVKQTAEAAGVAVVPMSEVLPDNLSYVPWMASNIDRLDKALRQHG